MKILKVIGIVAVVVALGIFLGWLGSRRTSVPPQSMAPAPSPAPSLVASQPGGARPSAISLLPSKHPSNSAVLNAQPVALAPGASNAVPDWEDKLDEILVADKVEDSAKARQLLDLFPRLPEDGQVEVAQHLSNLTSDEDYPALAQYLTNSTLPEPVLDVLMADALNRPNSLKLPVLLGLARNPQNPKSSEAKDVLELFLEEDYGSDWPAWQTKMDQWLKENPD